jgi:hypothetical protein
MDETLVMTACDLCGRPYFAFDGSFDGEKMGDMSTQMVREFFYAVSYSRGDESSHEDHQRHERSSQGGGTVQILREDARRGHLFDPDYGCAFYKGKSLTG